MGEAYPQIELQTDRTPEAPDHEPIVAPPGKFIVAPPGKFFDPARRYSGIVRIFQSGYGFVESPELRKMLPGSNDALLHKSQVKGFQAGHRVTFSIKFESQEPHAC